MCHLMSVGKKVGYRVLQGVSLLLYYAILSPGLLLGLGMLWRVGRVLQVLVWILYLVGGSACWGSAASWRWHPL